jgi:oligogalacturonide lyase
MYKFFLLFIALASCSFSFAQQELETGGKEMPNEWIDKDTHHLIIKLTRNDRNNLSFYFHNNPFVGDSMIFYSTVKTKFRDYPQDKYNPQDKQLFLLNLKTLQTE